MAALSCVTSGRAPYKLSALLHHDKSKTDNTSPSQHRPFTPPACILGLTAIPCSSFPASSKLYYSRSRSQSHLIFHQKSQQIQTPETTSCWKQKAKNLWHWACTFPRQFSHDPAFFLCVHQKRKHVENSRLTGITVKPRTRSVRKPPKHDS